MLPPRLLDNEALLRRILRNTEQKAGMLRQLLHRLRASRAAPQQNAPKAMSAAQGFDPPAQAPPKAKAPAAAAEALDPRTTHPKNLATTLFDRLGFCLCPLRLDGVVHRCTPVR